MRNAMVFVAATGLLVVMSADASAQMTPILRTNISAQTAPNYGCDGWNYTNAGRWYTLTRVPGGSPSGNDSLRFVGLRHSDTNDKGWGCFFTSSLEPSPAQGAVRYVRWRMRYVSPINWRSDNRLGAYEPNNRTAPDKMFVLGNNCENTGYQPTRVILWQYAEAPSRSVPMLRFTQNIGAGAEVRGVPADAWINVQLKIVSSSSATANDGSLHIYLNNNNFSSPTRSASGIQIKTSGWGRNTCAESNIVWGDASYNTLSDDDSSANNVTDLADFEYDDQFDPTWAIGSPMPNAPANLRVTPGEASLFAPVLGALVLLVRRRDQDGPDSQEK